MHAWFVSLHGLPAHAIADCFLYWDLSGAGPHAHQKNLGAISPLARINHPQREWNFICIRSPLREVRDPALHMGLGRNVIDPG